VNSSVPVPVDIISPLTCQKKLLVWASPCLEHITLVDRILHQIVHFSVRRLDLYDVYSYCVNLHITPI
jgi:hypothetical protein